LSAAWTRVEDARATSVGSQELDPFHPDPLQETAGHLADGAADDPGQASVEDHVEAVVAEVVTERAGRPADQVRGYRLHRQAVGVGQWRPCHDRCGRPVPEDHRGGEVVEGGIARLEGQRGQLDRDDQHALVWVRGQVTVAERDRGRTSRAAELGDRNSNHVVAQTEALDQVDVEGRHEVAGAGDGDDHVDLVRVHRGSVQCLAGSRFREVGGVPRVEGHRVRQGARLEQLSRVLGEVADAAGLVDS